MNSVIKYPGAKWSLAQWIISKFPPHHSKQILINIRLQVRERDLIGDFVNLLMLSLVVVEVIILISFIATLYL